MTPGQRVQVDTHVFGWIAGTVTALHTLGPDSLDVYVVLDNGYECFALPTDVHPIVEPTPAMRAQTDLLRAQCRAAYRMRHVVEEMVAPVGKAWDRR